MRNSFGPRRNAFQFAVSDDILPGVEDPSPSSSSSSSSSSSFRAFDDWDEEDEEKFGVVKKEANAFALGARKKKPVPKQVKQVPLGRGRKRGKRPNGCSSDEPSYSIGLSDTGMSTGRVNWDDPEESKMSDRDPFAVVVAPEKPSADRVGKKETGAKMTRMPKPVPQYDDSAMV